MRPLLVVFVLWIGLSCQKDIDRTDTLYGKWVLVSGPALAKRQVATQNQAIYFVFTQSGSIESNGSNCYSFTFGKVNELLINNGCVDCSVAGCDQSVWHYSFTSPNQLRLEFQPGDVGFLQRQ